MNFRIKCALKTLIGKMPYSNELDYFTQKYLSRSMPPRKKDIQKKYRKALYHHEIFKKYGSVDSDKAVVYEIGCGWHLAMALGFSTLGYHKIIALDVTEHLRPELINTTLRYIKEDNLIAFEPSVVDENNLKNILRDEYRIDLLVPCDSAKTGLADRSVDYIYSHNVFEHIPPELIPHIMDECFRVLDDNGVISFVIDYSDHYTGFDKSITQYNFLRYSEKEWKKYNPPLHYVNRLRHSDFVRMFMQAGFEIVEENVIRPKDWSNIVKDFPFDSMFKEKYTLEDLSITFSKVVLKKASRHV